MGEMMIKHADLLVIGVWCAIFLNHAPISPCPQCVLSFSSKDVAKAALKLTRTLEQMLFASKSSFVLEAIRTDKGLTWNAWNAHL